jgi:hypothetical protein
MGRAYRRARARKSDLAGGRQFLPRCLFLPLRLQFAVPETGAGLDGCSGTQRPFRSGHPYGRVGRARRRPHPRSAPLRQSVVEYRSGTGNEPPAHRLRRPTNKRNVLRCLPTLYGLSDRHRPEWYSELGLWDWLPRAGSIETKSEFTSTVAYYYHAKLVAEQAAALGKQQDAAKYTALAESIKTAFNRRFFDAAKGRYAQGSQTAQSLPLMFDMAPATERKRVLQSLVEAVRASGNKLSAGFIGTMPTFYVLSDAGYGDLAFEMVKDGWFHMLADGNASTLGESPYTRYGGYGSGHHQFGACIAGWMYRCLAGIRPDLSGPGYKKLTIKPAIIGDLKWVKAHCDCIYGRVAINWKREDNTFTLEVTIPVNTTATVFIPAASPNVVTESGKPVAQSEGVTLLRVDAGAVVYQIGAGVYRFASRTR